MLTIQTLTAPQSALVELILIRNKIPVNKNVVTTGNNKFEEFEVEDKPANWIEKESAIERKLVRKNQNDYVTFNMMASQNAKILYDHNTDNLKQQQDQLKVWVMDVAKNISSTGKEDPQEKQSELLKKIKESNDQNVFEVYQEVLFWEGILD